MAKYSESLNERIELKRLIDSGMSADEAIKTVYPDNSNRSTYLKRWQKNGVYPFGLVGKPSDQIGLIDLPPARTDSPTAISNELITTIQAIVQREIAKTKPTIEVVRPRLARSLETSSMKSFRCPILLWKMAQEKADTLNMSLNGVVESLLFQWLGRPDELLKK